MPELLPRHRMVTIDPAAWPQVLAAHPDLPDQPLVAGWAERGWPLVVRRPAAGDVDGQVPLGLPLPPAHGRGRHRLGVRPEAVLRTALPPALRETAACAPPTWGPAIAALLALQPQTRCFGSLAWRHLTGLTYLTARSDLDLLWHVASAAEADRMAAGLSAIAKSTPIGLDGELVTPAGLAVHWREWASDAAELLVKAPSGARVQPRGEVLT